MLCSASSGNQFELDQPFPSISLNVWLIQFGPPQIESALQQIGFQRKKRGYNSLVLGPENLSLNKEPDDPYFQYQWYLVSSEAGKSSAKL